MSGYRQLHLITGLGDDEHVDIEDKEDIGYTTKDNKDDEDDKDDRDYKDDAVTEGATREVTPA